MTTLLFHFEEELHMNIAKQIKTYRQRAGLTQEKLAELLNVTPQAVSKWENEVSMPDIALLPELSAILGITIDELFQSSGETHLKRIENMLNYKLTLTHEDYLYAKTRLEELSLDSKLRPRCLSMKLWLNMSYSETYREKAKQSAWDAVEAEQTHMNYSELNAAYNGYMTDWSFNNHAELIEIFKAHIEKFPDKAEPYLRLVDNLIDDGRFDEAEIYMEKIKVLKPGIHDYIYRAEIAAAKHGIGADEEILNEMTEKFPESDKAWFARANICARQGKYTQALEYFRRAAELEKAPRFIDTQQSIASICTIIGDIVGAVAAYEAVVKILREDWKTPEGEQIDGYLDKIKKLKAMRK